jgi:hypothetical protein
MYPLPVGVSAPKVQHFCEQVGKRFLFSIVLLGLMLKKEHRSQHFGRSEENEWKWSSLEPKEARNQIHALHFQSQRRDLRLQENSSVLPRSHSTKVSLKPVIKKAKELQAP